MAILQVRSVERIRGFGDYVLYKSTFTYLLTNLLYLLKQASNLAVIIYQDFLLKQQVLPAQAVCLTAISLHVLQQDSAPTHPPCL